MYTLVRTSPAVRFKTDGQKRELVVFVTPRIVNPDTERIRKLIDDIKARYKQARDEVTYGIFD